MVRASALQRRGRCLRGRGNDRFRRNYGCRGKSVVLLLRSLLVVNSQDSDSIQSCYLLPSAPELTSVLLPSFPRDEPLCGHLTTYGVSGPIASGSALLSRPTCCVARAAGQLVLPPQGGAHRGRRAWHLRQPSRGRQELRGVKKPRISSYYSVRTWICSVRLALKCMWA